MASEREALDRAAAAVRAEAVTLPPTSEVYRSLVRMARNLEVAARGSSPDDLPPPPRRGFELVKGDR